jgi:hypothetical protein
MVGNVMPPTNVKLFDVFKVNVIYIIEYLYSLSSVAGFHKFSKNLEVSSILRTHKY